MHSCKTPCTDCPFRKNSLPGWLSDYTPRELHNIIMAEKPFPCHMTHPNNIVTYEDAGSEEYPLCAGALQYMKKAAKLPLNPELRALVSGIDRTQLDNILTVPEFFEHHSKKISSI